MNRPGYYKLVIAGVTTLCALPVAADSLSNALSDGEAHFNLRYRYEFVDQDGLADNANASTLRARFNYLSGDWNGFRAFAELDAVTALLVDNYNSGSGTSSVRRNRYPVVADPDYAEANQAYLQYSGWNDTQLRVGRQRILLDNQRFVGGVGWRQNEQTYDALSIAHTPTANAQIYYAYVGDVNRIFGDDVPAGDHDTTTHLLNLSYTIEDTGKLSGYYYSIDNNDAAAFSTGTTGIRFAGKTQLAEKPVNYLVEFARQKDMANNPVNYDANYFRIDASINLGSVTPSIGYESLAGNGSVSAAAFRTPLATLHAFNGWADQFLGTPDTGLVDTWLGVSGKIDVWSWKALYHDFKSEVGSRNFGDELDVSLARKFGDDYALLVKAAFFDGAGISDVTKFWLMFTANF